MQISSNRKFLFINFNDVEVGNEITIAVIEELDEVLQNWRANSRVSPIWRLEDGLLEQSPPDLHPSGTIFFVAMINPVELELVSVFICFGTNWILI